MKYKAQIFCDGFNKEYIDYILRNPLQVNEKMINQSAKSLRNRFKCNVPNVSGTRPTSVHALRPEDIEIVAALGDSLTVFSKISDFN